MNTSKTLANHLEQLFFSKNWTGSSFPEALEGISWQQATQKIKSFNTIAVLVYHIGYYIKIQRRVLDGGPLEGSDTESFLAPPIKNEVDWNALKDDLFENVRKLITQIQEFEDEKLQDAFANSKYGTYLRNFIGVSEHSHYHLGQIVLLKKML